MPEIICIKRSGVVKSVDLSSLQSLPINLGSLSISDKKKIKVFKRYSSECDFNLDDYTVTILGKTEGKAGSENQKELPPPIDKEIYFDNVYAVAHRNDSLINLSIKDFEEFYDSAFGGFDDLGGEDSWSDELEENTEDREFINDESDSPNGEAIEEADVDEYEFSEDDDTTEDYIDDKLDDDITSETSDEILNDVSINNENITIAYNKGFNEGKKFYYLVQEFLRELDISLPKRRKQFYSLCSQELGEIIYKNHEDNKKVIIEWLENKITEETGEAKKCYKKYLKRYREDIILSQYFNH